MTLNTSDMKRIIGLTIFFSVIFIITGITLPFIELDGFIKIKNDGYVSAIFSLSGVFLYFAALMYQIKEYRLQVEELKKSVEAQTKSSEALEEQKRILLEQNTNNLIFGMIESFNKFKSVNNINESINEVIYDFQTVIINYLPPDLNPITDKQQDFNKSIALLVKHRFEVFIVQNKNYLLLKKYVQFIYNILSLIESNKSNLSNDNFTPFFYSQLNTNETILLYLSNLVETPNMPFYNNLKWDYYITKEIIEKLKSKKTILCHESIDITKMTACFNELRQK